MQEIVTLLSSKIPHENIYLVKSRMVNYPYKNYHFFSELNLKALFGDKNEFEITFLSNCKRFTLPLTLSEYDGFLDFKARTFAVTLKDNGIAKIIGMPTGGKPSSYGMPKRYKMPNSNIDFRVSRCLFLRPDKEHDNDIALVPDTFPGIMQS